MDKEISTVSEKIGLPPGSLVYVGSSNTAKATMTEVSFDVTNYHQKEVKEISEFTGNSNSDLTTWLDVDGVHDIDLIRTIGNQFDLDSLMLEDIVNTKHRPKSEEFTNCLFACLKIIWVDETTKSISYEQLSLVLGKNYLISFQENKSVVFEKLKTRIEASKGKIRERKEDYLFYRLMDTVVDNYFLVTDHLNETFEELEDILIKDNKKEAKGEIFKLKKEIQILKRSIVPLREAIAVIIKDENDYIDNSTEKYLRDLYQHIVQLTETIDTQNENINNSVDLYMAMISTKMNEIMQVLTMFATIFIPLTFIAGIYGMNFDNIPELHWKYGYLFIWIIMGAIIIGFMIYFRKKKWI